jgi:integrase
VAIRFKNDRYIIDYYPQGRKGRRSIFTLPPGTIKEDAVQIEKELRSRKNQHHHTLSEKIVRLMPHYLRHCEMHQSAETARDKRSHYALHILPFFGHLHITDLNNRLIMTYKEQMKEKQYRKRTISNRTISKGLNYFSAFLRWAEEETGTSPIQPLRIRKLPHTRPVPIVLSLEEVMAFIRSADKPYSTMFKTFFYLGLRNRAVRRQRWEDVDWSKHAIKTIEKGNKPKWHPLPDDLFEDLRQLYIESKSEWIYPSPRNHFKPITDLRRAVRRARKKAGITKRVYPHLLRHSIATHLLESDVDIRQIQAFLGHSQISTTEWYTQVSLEKKRQALEKAGIRTSKM